MSEKEKKLLDEIPELSSVKIGSTKYNIKDAKARDDIAAETARAQTEEAKKLEAYKVSVTGADGGKYTGAANVPVYFDTEAAADSIKVNAYSIELNTTKEQTAVKNSLTVPAATQSAAGLMSAADKTKLDVTLPAADETEKQARISADETLQSNINAEATARTNADNALQDNIDAEERDRKAADSSLDTRITALESKGRYLSTWDATTGQPDTYPVIPETVTELTYTYQYRSGDYYIVNKAAAANNLMPDGGSITATRATVDDPWVWSIPSTEFTGSTLNLGDQFQFDGTTWTYIACATTVAFKNIQGDAEENTNLKGKLDTLRAADAAEAAAREAADADLDNRKVEKTITTAAGSARIFNEADGGGAKFENADGTASFAGVNSDTNGGIGAQLYDIDVAANKGSKLDVTKSGIYYTTGDKSALAPTQRDIAENEIAVKKDINDEASARQTEDAKKLDKAAATVAGVNFDANQDVPVDDLKEALNLHELAYSDTATGSTTIETINSIEMNPLTISGNAAITYTDAEAVIDEKAAFTPAGEVTLNAFTQTPTEITSTGSYTPAGDIEVDADFDALTKAKFRKALESEAADATQIEGTNADSAVVITPSTDVFVKSLVDGENDAASFTQGEFKPATISDGFFNAGTLPTHGDDTFNPGSFVKGDAVVAATEGMVASVGTGDEKECLIFTAAATDNVMDYDATYTAPSFTQGTFTQGSLPSIDTSKFFGGSHATDTFTSKKIPVVGTTASAWVGYTSAVAAGQVFTGAKYINETATDKALKTVSFKGTSATITVKGSYDRATANGASFAGTTVANLIPSKIVYKKADATAAFSDTQTPTVKTYTRTAKSVTITVTPDTPTV